MANLPKKIKYQGHTYHLVVDNGEDLSSEGISGSGTPDNPYALGTEDRKQHASPFATTTTQTMPAPSGNIVHNSAPPGQGPRGPVKTTLRHL